MLTMRQERPVLEGSTASHTFRGVLLSLVDRTDFLALDHLYHRTDISSAVWASPGSVDVSYLRHQRHSDLAALLTSDVGPRTVTSGRVCPCLLS